MQYWLGFCGYVRLLVNSDGVMVTLSALESRPTSPWSRRSSSVTFLAHARTTEITTATNRYPREREVSLVCVATPQMCLSQVKRGCGSFRPSASPAINSAEPARHCYWLPSCLALIQSAPFVCFAAADAREQPPFAASAHSFLASLLDAASCSATTHILQYSFSDRYHVRSIF